jgi:acetyl esterase/lipase
MKDPQVQPLRDALKGISVLKKVCASLQLPWNCTGVLGFSAGGHLAAWAVQEYLTSTVNAEEKAFPGFQILAYPVIDLSGVFTHLGSRNQLAQGRDDMELFTALSIHLNINEQTRPAYLVHAKDDITVPPQNSQLMEAACKANGVPVACEWLMAGGHGFGLYANDGTETWLKNALNWAEGLY